MTKSADVERLLANTDWLRGLARRLVGSASADDVVQETLIAAIHSSPAADRPFRPWLGGVLRNVTRMQARGDSRRVRREQAIAVEPVETARPDQAVYRLEVHRAMCTLVLGLDEPFRTTLVQHYFDGLTMADIARKDNVPEGTVRWRHKQAIERLRVRLDADCGGDRRAWISSLAPIGASSNTPWIVGGLIVNKLVIGMIVAAAAALLVWHRVASPSSADVVAAPAASSEPTAQATVPGKAGVPQHVTRLATATDRQRVADQITTSQSVRHSVAAPPSLPAAPNEHLDKAVIRAAMREVIPYLAECYEQALPTLPSPDLAISAHLSLRSDPDVGMLVDATEPLIDDQGQPLPAGLDECLRSTLQTLELPPLASGDHLDVTYPFSFRHASPESAGSVPPETHSGWHTVPVTDRP